jgi:1,4-dihydroxy-2-naphthoate octaprenyltransferase
MTVYALFAMARPSHLLLIAVVYLYGALVAKARGTPLELRTTLLGLLALLATSASVHYANEYADHETDRLTRRTHFSGGSGALARTGLPRRVALRAAWIAAGLGGLLAVWGWRVGIQSLASLALLLSGGFFGWMYSLPPLSLAWRAWGEMDNALLGGLVLPLYGYALHTGSLDPAVVAAFLPFAGTVFTNLLATTWPDRHADAAVGKATLATRLPVPRLRSLYLGATLLTFLSLLPLVGCCIPPQAGWAGLGALPLALWGASRYARRRSPLPGVATMVVMLSAQAIAWWWLGGL